jgi:LysR family transcriptional regulator, nitrogen assimilation regulatory protein
LRLTLRQLQYFVAAAEAGSLARAAERLHVTPTALGLQIKELEEQFQVSLLDRHSRGTRPTATGSEFYERALRVIEAAAEAERMLAPQTDCPVVRLGAPPSIARLIGVDAMFHSGSGVPALDIQISEGWTVDLMDRLLRNELDLVVGYELVHSRDVIVREVVEESFVFACAPGRYRGVGAIPLEQVLQTDLVFYGEQSVSYRLALAEAARRGLALQSQRHVQSINVWLSMVIRGLGTAIASPIAFDGAHERGELEMHPIEGDPLRGHIGIATRAGQPGPLWMERLVQNLTTLLRRTLARARALELQD